MIAGILPMALKPCYVSVSRPKGTSLSKMRRLLLEVALGVGAVVLVEAVVEAVVEVVVVELEVDEALEAVEGAVQEDGWDITIL